MRDRTGPVKLCMGGCGRFVAVDSERRAYRHILYYTKSPNAPDNVCPGSELEMKEPLWQVLGYESEEVYLHSLDDSEEDNNFGAMLDKQLYMQSTLIPMDYGLSEDRLAKALGLHEAREDVESTSSFEERLRKMSDNIKRGKMLHLIVVESRDFVAVYRDSVMGDLYKQYPRTSMEAFDGQYVKEMLLAQGHFAVLDTDVIRLREAMEAR